MSSFQEDEIIEIANSSKYNIVPQTESNSLKDNVKSKTSSPLPFRTAPKRYLPKFYKEWLSDPQYSSFLNEYKNDARNALCIACNIQFSIENSRITYVNCYMKTENIKSVLNLLNQTNVTVSLQF
ncbi:unnamed protein product [Rotaria sp. Silwood1]|nr:unnamed protein product [Rotaria sp. Silwood1]